MTSYQIAIKGGLVECGFRLAFGAAWGVALAVGIMLLLGRGAALAYHAGLWLWALL